MIEALAAKSKSGLTEQQQAAATKAKLAGPKAIYADGNVIDLSNPVAAKAQWQGIETKAVQAGTYEGKSLTTVEGKSAMMYDKVRATEGLDHFQAVAAVKSVLAS